MPIKDPERRKEYDRAKSKRKSKKALGLPDGRHNPVNHKGGYPKTKHRDKPKRTYIKRTPDQPLSYSVEKARKQRYGVTPEQYEAMYNEQNGLCALLCGRPAECIDHCHDTKFVRGLLCRKCNSALGFFDDDPEVMIRAAGYVVGGRFFHNLSNMTKIILTEDC
jgi:recombination endonuclease VII